MASRNLCGKREAIKQRSWDSVRVWWAPVLSRGKLHVEVLGDGFPGEAEAGAAILVAKVRAALNIRFQSGGQPATIFVDRGRGFWHIGTGRITVGFRNALAEHGLRTFYGDDGSAQPGNLQEVLLHETAVSWIRHREVTTRPPMPWQETVEDYGARLRAVVQDINDHLDVEGLCKALPKRIQQLRDAEGDRICH